MITKGCHHIGLTVSKLEESTAFFTDVLGWQEVGANPAYPAIFVSDGTVMVTLWRVKDEKDFEDFDKDRNVGLHHIALMVESEDALNEVYKRVNEAKDVEIEFPPEYLRQGPAKHMMCHEPSGVRVEFIWPGN